MTNTKKFLLIFPPFWTPIAPHLALPTLVSQLKNNGFNAHALDLNIEFFKYILNEEQINNCVNKITLEYSNLEKNKKNILENNATYEEKISNYKYKEYKKLLEEDSDLLKYSKRIENAINIVKKEETFFEYKKLFIAWNIIKKSLYISSLPYFPYIINKNFCYSNKYSEPKYDEIKKIIFNESQNIFIEFYKKEIEKIKKNNYSYIGISINSHIQLISGLTLAYLLKKETKAHINIGGCFFSRIIEKIKKIPEFFDLFADSISINEGDISIIELAKFINQEISINEVPNLIHKQGTQIITNKNIEPTAIHKTHTPDFSDFDFKEYFSPFAIIPIQTSKGCYWNKCTFCDHSYNKKYSTKKIDDLVSELQEYKELYNAKYFDIVDEAVHPNFLDKLSDKLIENKLDIRFKICARLEEKIDKKLLNKAYKAGLRFIQWGFETGNKRIHTLINKGVNFEKRIKILKLANEVGIVNYLFSFIGFPSETYSEAMDTINFFKKNNKYIQVPIMGVFSLYEQSAMTKNPREYGIRINESNEYFSNVIKFSSNNILTNEEKEKIFINYGDIIKKYYIDKPFYHFGNISDEAELLMLYNDKHSLKALKKIKISTK